MRLSRDVQEALRRTVEATGYKGKIGNLDCVHYSPPEMAANQEIRAKVNETLLETLLKGHVGTCVHITGKMHALADPFHSRLCAEVAKRSNTRFTVVYDPPEEATDTLDGVSDCAKLWSDAPSSAKLNAVRLIGNSYVDVHAGRTNDLIQYSVFGDRYTQLQERHDEDRPGKSAKRIWLIKSDDLNGFLAEKALATIDVSTDVDDGVFRSFFTKVNGVASRNMLNDLANGGPRLPEKLLTSMIVEFDPDASRTLGWLQDLLLLERGSDGTLSVTEEGMRFVSNVS